VYKAQVANDINDICFMTDNVELTVIKMGMHSNVKQNNLPSEYKTHQTTV